MGNCHGRCFSNAKKLVVKLDAEQCDFLITVAGIRTSKDEQDIFHRQIHSLVPFRHIHNSLSVYNPTRYGSGGDFLQIVGHEIGFIQAVDVELARLVNSAARKLKTRSCKCWRIYVVAHSQGTMILKRSLNWVDSEAKAHLYLVGLGGETSFNAQRDAVAFAHNLANTEDPVPNFLRNLTPFEGNDDIHSFDNGLKGYEAHSFDDSYWNYLRNHDISGFLVPP